MARLWLQLLRAAQPFNNPSGRPHSPASVIGGNEHPHEETQSHRLSSFARYPGLDRTGISGNIVRSGHLPGFRQTGALS
jgi:hypothetical protein